MTEPGNQFIRDAVIDPLLTESDIIGDICLKDQIIFSRFDG